MTLVAIATSALVGCSKDDPTVSGKKLNEDRAKMLTPEEREMMKVPSDFQGAPQGSNK